MELDKNNLITEKDVFNMVDNKFIANMSPIDCRRRREDRAQVRRQL